MNPEPAPVLVYLHHEGQQLGPYSLETARDLVTAGSVPPEVPAWCEGMSDWVPLSDLLPPVAPPEPPEASSGTRASGTFFAALPGAFVYPFRKDGLILLGTGTVFFWILGVAVRFSGFLSLVLSLYSAGYLASCLQNLIQSSARGEDEMPSWPDFTDVHEDILLPLLRIGATFGVCLGPGLALLAFGRGAEAGTEAGPTEWAGWSLLAAGALYLPMALLAVAMADSVAALSPRLVVTSILRVPREYAAAYVVLALSVGLSLALAHTRSALDRIPGISSMIEGFLGLFCLTVQMRILGLLYHHNSRRLDWF